MYKCLFCWLSHALKTALDTLPSEKIQVGLRNSWNWFKIASTNAVPRRLAGG
jgi:hypothetical protein